jgi:hypothetical protein
MEVTTMNKDGRNDVYGSPDRLTLIAIAMLVYVVTVVFHELGGHGGACMAFGGFPHELGAYYFVCDDRGMRGAPVRLVAAAGNTANLVMAAIAFPFLKQARSWYGKWFWWLMFTVSLLDWSGYFLFSGFSGIGDWGGEPGEVFYGVAPQWIWRIALVLAGISLYVASASMAARQLSHFVHSATEARRITFIAYVAGGLLALLVGLLNPIGVAIILTSALASTLGGTSGLLWLTRMMPGGANAVPSSHRIGRSWRWIIASLAVILLFALVLGPSRVLR